MAIIGENCTDDSIDMCNSRWHNRVDQCPLTCWTQLPAMHMPVERHHRLPLELRGAPAVLIQGTGRDVVRPGQVVVRNHRQVDVAVVPVGRTPLIRRLVEWRTDVEVWS